MPEVEDSIPLLPTNKYKGLESITRDSNLFLIDFSNEILQAIIIKRPISHLDISALFSYHPVKF
jgi:hypothetical protein